MRRKLEDSVWHRARGMCTPWVLYYVGLSVNFAATLYVNVTTAVPYGVVGDPKCVYLFIMFYMFFCGYITSPRTIMEHDDLYRSVIVKRIFAVATVFDIVALALLNMLMTEENINVVVIFVMVLQGVYFMETVLVILGGELEKRAIEAFLSIRVHTYQVGTEADYNFGIVRLLGPFVYQICLACVVYLGTVETVSEYSVLSSGLQMVFCIWTHYVLVHMAVGWISISCLLKITTQSDKGTCKMMYIVTKKNTKHIGVYVYMAFMSMVLGVVEGINVVVMREYWPSEAKEYTTRVCQKWFPNWFMYSIYGTDTITIASILFNTTPDKAIQRLVGLMEDTNDPVVDWLTTVSSTETTRPLSHYIVMIILIPVAICMNIGLIYSTDIGDYTKLIIMMGWCTYAVPSLEYIYTETLHRCLLLVEMTNTERNLSWLDQYLTALFQV